MCYLLDKNKKLNIFTEDYLPENFFAPASNHLAYKDFHIDFMYNIYRELEKSYLDFKMDKDVFRERMNSFIEIHEHSYGDAFYARNKNEKDRNDFITDQIRIFIDSGWLEEQYDISGSKTLILTQYITTLLEWFEELKSNNQKYLTSNIMSIKNNLLAENLDYDLLQNVLTNCRNFKKDLMHMSEGMKNLILRLANNENISFLTNNIIGDIHSPIFFDYKRLKTDTNIIKYKREIVDKLLDLSSDTNNCLSNIVDKYIDENKGLFTDKQLENEKKNLYQRIQRFCSDMYNFFDNDYQVLLSTIDKNKARYIRIAQEQLAIFNKHDESDLVKIQKLLKSSSEYEIPTDNLLNIFSINFMDTSSFQKKPEKINRTKAYRITESSMSEEEKNRLANELLNSTTIFNEKNVSELLFTIFSDKNSVEIKDIPVHSKSDLTLLALITTYFSNNPQYILLSQDEYYETPYGRIQNYKISKKEKYSHV